MDSEEQFTPPVGFAQLLGFGQSFGDGLSAIGEGLPRIELTVFSSFRGHGFGGIVLVAWYRRKPPTKTTEESEFGRFPLAIQPPSPLGCWQNTARLGL
jgi:hypothetical protein